MSKKKTNPKVFISYDYDKDRNYKNLTKAWSKKNNIDCKFKDKSTDISVNSKNKDYIKQVISKDIKSCETFVVLVGKDTHKNEWINWEIEKASQENKHIGFILLEKDNQIPKKFKEHADSVFDSFSLDNLKKCIVDKKLHFDINVGIELKRIEC